MRPPIADPFAPPNSFPPEETRVFAQSFWRTYFGTLGMMAICMAFLALYGSWRFGKSLSQQGFFLIVMLGINPLLAAIGAKFRPLKVTRHGVQGPPLVGFVEWGQMKAAHTLWMGFPYALISQSNKRSSALWIPMTLREPQAFARTLEEWAPAENPLRLWVQKRKL